MRLLPKSAMYKLPAPSTAAAEGRIQLGAGGGSVIAAVSRRAVARHGREAAGAQQFHHAGILGVHDIDIAAGIGRQAARRVELVGSVARRSPSRDPAAGHRGDGPVGGHFANRIVGGIGDVEIAGGIHRYALRSIELRRRGRSAVAAVAEQSVARHRADDVAGHLAQPQVQCVADEHVACGIHRHPDGIVQRRRVGGGIAGAESNDVRAHHRLDPPRLDLEVGPRKRLRGGLVVDFTDAAVALLHDVQIAALIERHSHRRVQRGQLRAGAIARITLGARSRVGGAVVAHHVVNVPGRLGGCRGRHNLADVFVHGVRNPHVARGIHRHVRRRVQLRLDRGAVLAEIPGVAIAGDGLNQPVGGDLADQVVAGVGNVDIAGGIGGHSLRPLEQPQEGP